MIFIEITEYLFSLVYRKYLKMNEDIPGVYALSIVSLLQFLNIAFIALLFTLFNVISIDDFSNTLIVTIILSLLIINYLYIYKKRGREQILRKYSGNTSEIKKVKKYSLVYVIITLVLFLALFIYFLLNRR